MTVMTTLSPYLGNAGKGVEVLKLIVTLSGGWSYRRNISTMTKSAVERMRELDDRDLSVLLEAIIETKNEKLLEVFLELKKLQANHKFQIAMDCSEKNSQLRRSV